MSFNELHPQVQLLYKWDAWAEHPKYTRRMWKEEVVNSDTQSGYWEWTSTKLNTDKAPPEIIASTSSE